MATQNLHAGCKRAKAYAWAQYYEAMGRQADNAIIVVNQVPMTIQNGKVKVESIPSHFTNEFIEMAKELRKEFSCPICLDMVSSDTIDITHCGHIYCKTCLTAIKGQREPKCAICRKNLPSTA